jgi:hypothetical protein
MNLRASSVLTGWGAGLAAIPADVVGAARSRTVVPLDPRPRRDDRLRRATRECLLGIDAVEALLEDAGLDRGMLAGPETALLYVTAAAYGASNRTFVEGGGGALHFPYTAPSAVPAEVAIEFGMCGPYAVVIGGAAATIDAMAHASRLLARGACARAIVLAVETFVECEALHHRGGTAPAGPMVEAAAAALFEPGEPGLTIPRRVVSEPGGFACAPLMALARASAEAVAVEVRGQWRGRDAGLTVGIAEAARSRAAEVAAGKET